MKTLQNELDELRDSDNVIKKILRDDFFKNHKLYVSWHCFVTALFGLAAWVIFKYSIGETEIYDLTDIIGVFVIFGFILRCLYVASVFIDPIGNMADDENYSVSEDALKQIMESEEVCQQVKEAIIHHLKTSNVKAITYCNMTGIVSNLRHWAYERHKEDEFKKSYIYSLISKEVE